jgi:hypothetical protein
MGHTTIDVESFRRTLTTQIFLIAFYTTQFYGWGTQLT